MREFNRGDRVSAEIQRELAYLIKNKVRDGRLAEVTIQEVRVTRDLSYAKVYFTVMDVETVDEVTKQLVKAAGFLRKQLGGLMKLRTVPQLKFVYDESIEKGNHLSSLIDKAIAKDNESDDTDFEQS